MTAAPTRRIEPADEAQLFRAIDRWVEKEVKPIVKEYDHADRYPTEIVEQMKELGLFGATVSPEYGGLGLPATHLRQDRDAHLARVDGDHRHLQLAPDAGAGDREVRHPGAEGRSGCRSSRPARCAAASR